MWAHHLSRSGISKILDRICPPMAHGNQAEQWLACPAPHAQRLFSAYRQQFILSLQSPRAHCSEVERADSICCPPQTCMPAGAHSELCAVFENEVRAYALCLETLFPVMGEGHPFTSLSLSPWGLLPHGHSGGSTQLLCVDTRWPAFYDYRCMTQLSVTLWFACLLSVRSSGCPGTHPIVQTDLELTAVLPQPPKP